MKRLVPIFLAIVLLFGCTKAFAQGSMGVVVIGGSETQTEPVSLDDIKLDVDFDIDGYGTLRFYGFEYKDIIYQYQSGSDDPWYNDSYESGNEAEYAILRMDITNTTTKAHDFLASSKVKVIFNDVYEYGGWAYQVNYNNRVKDHFQLEDKNNQNTLWSINPEDNFPVDPMYEGHYMFGCTLPNAVVNSKQSLQMVITLDGNEITYNIRK